MSFHCITVKPAYKVHSFHTFQNCNAFVKVCLKNAIENQALFRKLPGILPLKNDLKIEGQFQML